MNVRYASFFTMLVLAGSMFPVHAFNINNWFSSLSPRSKSAVYVTAAALFAGVGYLTYKIWAKKRKQQERPIAVPIPAHVPPVRQDDAEIKEQVADAEIEHGGWKSQTFKVPQKATCVALGVNKQGDTIILVGSEGCIFYINEKTKLIKTIRFVGEDVKTIKILPNNFFIVQSRGYIRLCNLDGEVLKEFSACTFPEPYHDRPSFVGIDVGFDIQGKPLMSIAKTARHSLQGHFVMERHQLGHVDVVHFPYYACFDECVVARDEDGNMKIFCKKGVPMKWDVATGQQEPYGRSFRERQRFDTPEFMLADGDGNIMTYHGDNTIRLSSVKTGVQWGSATNLYTFRTAALGRDGHCVVNTLPGDIQVWDLKKSTCTTLPQSIFSPELRQSYISLDTRSLGNPYFVSAAPNGIVKLWTNEKEKEEQEAIANKALKVFEKFDRGSFSSVQRIIHSYVGPDAYQALAEIQREKIQSSASAD